MKQILEIACHFKVTLGVLATSIWIEAIVKQMKRSSTTVGVRECSVNLRQFYPSETPGNFSVSSIVTYDPHHYDGSLESITA